jgi:glycosyltransferase involved in cell wall biosynthesis
MPHAHLSNKVTAVVGVSEYILNRFVSLGYFKDTPLKYAIHNTRNFAGNGNSAPKADDQIVFGYIGSLAKHKGIELLLKTFEASQQANWHLKIAGKGAREYENDLMTRYRNPRIEFLGHQSPDDFFPMLDVSIVPSLWNEPLGMVVAESLLYGIPVIASNRGGIPEMIEDKNTGVIFDPAIPNSFENALAYMAQNIRGFREHKDAIRAKASRFSDQDAWAAKWLEIYKTALSHCSG